eukprot:4252082-Pyramimonas_sp.AAC.1
MSEQEEEQASKQISRSLPVASATHLSLGQPLRTEGVASHLRLSHAPCGVLHDPARRALALAYTLQGTLSHEGQADGRDAH